jgi:uncharacterized protein (TIGR03437 family)
MKWTAIVLAATALPLSAQSLVPPEFFDLYPVLQFDLATYQAILRAQWDGSKSPVLLGAEVTPADGYSAIYTGAQNNTLDTYYAQSITPYLNGFQSMGMTTVKFLIQFPMLYQPFYQAKGDTTGSTYANVVAFFQKLVNDLHSRGMKVIIQTQVQPAGNGPSTGDPLNLTDYYNGMPTFADYVQGRAQNALAIAQNLKPDYLNFSSEPDTEGPKTANSVAATALHPSANNPDFVSNVQYLQTTILNTLLAANLPGLHSSLKLVIGMGSWEYNLNAVLQNELAFSGVDVIDIHVHPINTLSATQDFLANILTIANAANAAGKETGMDEDWEYKERNSEFGSDYGTSSVSVATIDSRDHWSFWAPIDQAFLEAMVDTGYYEHMAYFSASEPDQFFAYLNYFSTAGCRTNPAVTNPPSSVCTSTQWNAASAQAVTQALSTSPVTLSNTGSFYAGLIHGTQTSSGPPSIAGIVSASAFGGFPSVAPGSWVEIYGSNLAPDTRGWAGSDFVGNNAPISLDGVSVSIGGQAAFVDYISPTQVNAELPSNISTGGVLQLTLSNGPATSAPVSLDVKATEPGLLAPVSFKVGENQYVVAQHSDGSYVLPVGAIAGIKSSPAKPGETIIIYGVGFGPVTPNIPAGQLVTESNHLSASLEILFGQTQAQLSYFGLAPDLVGLYQFNVVVPTVGDNDLVPLTFNLGGVPGTQTLFTAVQ